MWYLSSETTASHSEDRSFYVNLIYYPIFREHIREPSCANILNICGLFRDAISRSDEAYMRRNLR